MISTASITKSPPPFILDPSGEPLCLISSSVPSGADLLKVQYFKVMKTDCVDVCLDYHCGGVGKE